ncbi:MAG: hypothetical protein WCD37_03625 [Chloroflexia bacterium]
MTRQPSSETDTTNRRSRLGDDRDQRAELKVGSRTCQCQDCTLFFTGVTAFDTHLIHRHTQATYQPPLCMTPNQMLAAGLTPNTHDVWGKRSGT